MILPTTLVMNVIKWSFEYTVDIGCNEFSDSAEGKLKERHKSPRSYRKTVCSVFCEFWFKFSRSLPVRNRCYFYCQRAKSKSMKSSSVYFEYMQNGFISISVKSYWYWTYSIYFVTPKKWIRAYFQLFIAAVSWVESPPSLLDYVIYIDFGFHTIVNCQE